MTLTMPAGSAGLPRPVFVAALSLLALGTLAACSQGNDPPAQAAPEAGAEQAATDATDRQGTFRAATDPPAPAPRLRELDASEVAAQLNDVGRCMLEKVGEQRLSEGSTLQVQGPMQTEIMGWVGDPSISTWPRNPMLRLDMEGENRAWEVGLGTAVDRPDVGQMYKADSMAKSGFQTAVDLSALPPGTYRLRTVYDLANGSGMRLACNRDFRIRIGS